MSRKPQALRRDFYWFLSIFTWTQNCVGTSSDKWLPQDAFRELLSVKHHCSGFSVVLLRSNKTPTAVTDGLLQWVYMPSSRLHERLTVTQQRHSFSSVRGPFVFWLDFPSSSHFCWSEVNKAAGGSQMWRQTSDYLHLQSALHLTLVPSRL